ncbi:PcfK-like protein [Granulicatella balaenopterae]|uniref:PcfK-like protein n=1 Tax=Granulicatella balaenopterae TaxID=137733 RepID=A0A1H9I257_9LACT|nr:Cas9 inhibitor AcrIIA9 family protein [Granulicatella balaenopterae]SEQ68637.1 PcfK-like protein [Granulicatella balaenopterae]
MSTEDTKRLALDKLLLEIKDNKNKSINVIHNWLCEQSDNDLFQNILKKDKTIIDAFKYCTEKARKLAVSNCAMVEDTTVYQWIVDYYADDTIVIKQNKKTSVHSHSQITPTKPITFSSNNEESKGKEQLSLLDFL